MRARLLTLAQSQRRDFNQVLTAYATERLLYRLSCSAYAQRFVLKGARLFTLWLNEHQRPTRDLDLLGFGDSSSNAMRDAFSIVCETEVEQDGIKFDKRSIAVEDIRPSQDYDGQRVKLTAHLEKARIHLQIDVAFGDVITPGALIFPYTTLLSTLPAPRILVYPRETVIAEKLQAMVALDEFNTRMKDFYDLHVLGANFDYEGSLLGKAIKATFDRRKTPIPTVTPPCLLPQFAQSEERQNLWNAFLRRNGVSESDTLNFQTTLEEIRAFVVPPMLAAARATSDFTRRWQRQDGWLP